MAIKTLEQAIAEVKAKGFTDNQSIYNELNTHDYGMAAGALNGYKPETLPGSSSPGGVVYNPDGTRSVVDDYWSAHKPVDDTAFANQQADTRANFLKQQQAEIDSINNMYTSIIQQANQAGRDRLGSANVINALAGQRGSVSGQANVDKVNNANTQIIKGIEAEKANKIGMIINKYTKDISDELRYQNELRAKDTTAWLDYMGKKETENKATLKSHFDDLINNGVAPEEIPVDQWEPLANAMGYTTDQMKLLYGKMYQKQQDSWASAQAEALEKAAKNRAEMEKLAAETGKIGAETDKLYNEPILKAQEEARKSQEFKISTEKDMAAKGYKYVATPAERDALKKQGYEITTVGGRTYAKKPEMSELEMYEAKKKIDAKYKSSAKAAGISTPSYEAIKGDVDAIRGSDGYLDTAKYQRVRENIAVQEPKALSWFDKTYPPKVVLNPNDPTAQQYFKSGVNVNIGDQLNEWINGGQ